MQAYVLTKAGHLTANSPYIAAKVKKWYRRNIPVIPNGIAVPGSLVDRRSTPGPLIVGSVNNGFGELKNVHRLIDAFSLIREDRPDSILRLVGTGFEPSGPAEAYAKARGASEGVEFVGPIAAHEIAAFMRGIDVLVHPALEESFGMTLVEAIIEGTIVVGGRYSGAVPWVLGEGSAGVLVDVRDPAAIAQAVLSLPVAKDESWVLRQRAFEHVRANFSLDHVVDLYEDIYRVITS
jgi:L-malate glycosyltransferase